MDSFTSSSFSSKKILYGVITVCALASIACLPVEGTQGLSSSLDIKQSSSILTDLILNYSHM